MAVRALLDGLELDQPSGQPTTAPAASPPRAILAAKVQATALADELAEWERLRQQVRAARQGRGITLRTLAGELGMAVSTVESALQTRRPPSLRLQQHLTDWLRAPEVAAAPEETFPSRGARHGTTAGDGADQFGAP